MNAQDFIAMLSEYPRLVLCGPPWAGKTPLSLAAHDRPVIHTDDYIEGYDWENVGPKLLEDCRNLRSYLLEGVRAPWALRAGLKPDAVLWVENQETWAKLDGQQQGIAMASRKVLDQWLDLGLDVAYFERELG